MKQRISLAVPVFLAFFAAALLLAPRTEAGIIPLRSGTVVSKVDTGALSYIKAVDDAGKPFWILTSLCTIGENGRIDVLAGTRYDKVASDHLGTSPRGCVHRGTVEDRRPGGQGVRRPRPPRGLRHAEVGPVPAAGASADCAGFTRPISRCSRGRSREQVTQAYAARQDGRGRRIVLIAGVGGNDDAWFVWMGVAVAAGDAFVTALCISLLPAAVPARPRRTT